MPDPIDLIFNRLLGGVDPITVLALLSALSIVCRYVGKRIPESATGWQGFIRKAAKVIGLYTSNRITPHTTQAEQVERAIAVSSNAAQTANRAVHTVEHLATVGDLASSANDPTGVGERGFIRVSMLLPIGLLGGLFLLTGCAADQLRLNAERICSNTETAQLLLDQARDGNNKARIQQILDTVKRWCPLIQLTV